MEITELCRSKSWDREIDKELVQVIQWWQFRDCYGWAAVERHARSLFTLLPRTTRAWQILAISVRCIVQTGNLWTERKYQISILFWGLMPYWNWSLAPPCNRLCWFGQHGNPEIASRCQSLGVEKEKRDTNDHALQLPCIYSNLWIAAVVLSNRAHRFHTYMKCDLKTPIMNCKIRLWLLTCSRLENYFDIITKTIPSWSWGVPLNITLYVVRNKAPSAGRMWGPPSNPPVASSLPSGSRSTRRPSHTNSSPGSKAGRRILG